VNDDALTMAALRDELAELLLGGRVQRIVRPSDLAVGLEIYAGQRHQVLFSADPQAAGIRLARRNCVAAANGLAANKSCCAST
jgi:predicted ribosome quality control (RQC) complex YloA/Tae2 family protein